MHISIYLFIYSFIDRTHNQTPNTFQGHFSVELGKDSGGPMFP